MIRSKSTFDRYLKPYYILNLLLIFAYPITRSLLRWGGSSVDTFGFNREDSVMLLLCAILIVKYRKSCTFDHFIAEFFWLAKIAELTLYFFVNNQIFFYYLFACTSKLLIVFR